MREKIGFGVRFFVDYANKTLGPVTAPCPKPPKQLSFANPQLFCCDT